MIIYAENKRVYSEFEILKTYQAGISLKGFEVKAIKNGKISIRGSFGKIKDNEFFLIGAIISPYQAKNTPKDYDPQRTRKLLLQKKEIRELIGKIKERGLTLIPLKVYDKNGKIKIEIALAKALKKFEKKEIIRKKEEKRKLERVLKQY